MTDEGTDNQTDEREAQAAPAESETSNQESKETTDKAAPEENQEAPDEGSEPDESEAESEDKPKRRSGYDRMKRRAMLAEARLAEVERAAPAKATAEQDPEPKFDDFNGDYDAYQRAVMAHTVRKELRAAREADIAEERERRAREASVEAVSDFEERASEVRERIKDFDSVIDGYAKNGGSFSGPVRHSLMESDRGPELVYFLAKNPSIAAKLNSLTPLSAAREIGVLEAKLSSPSQRTTQAKRPIQPLSGGTKPAFDPSKASMDEYVAKRASGWKG